MKIKLFFVLGFSLYILPLSALHTHTHTHAADCNSFVLHF